MAGQKWFLHQLGRIKIRKCDRIQTICAGRQPDTLVEKGHLGIFRSCKPFRCHVFRLWEYSTTGQNGTCWFNQEVQFINLIMGLIGLKTLQIIAGSEKIVTFAIAIIKKKIC